MIGELSDNLLYSPVEGSAPIERDAEKEKAQGIAFSSANQPWRMSSDQFMINFGNVIFSKHIRVSRNILFLKNILEISSGNISSSAGIRPGRFAKHSVNAAVLCITELRPYPPFTLCRMNFPTGISICGGIRLVFLRSMIGAS